MDTFPGICFVVLCDGGTSQGGERERARPRSADFAVEGTIEATHSNGDLKLVHR